MKKFEQFDRVNQWDLPTIVNPEKICVCFEIPNERYHIRAFWTALYKLSLWNSWATDEAHTGREVASVWRDVLNLAMGDENTMGCTSVTPIIPEFRFTLECGLEVSTDGENYVPVPGWITNAADCYTGAAGADGAPGADGLDGADGTNGEDGAVGATGATGATGAAGVDGSDAVCEDCSSEDVVGDEEDWEQQACAMAMGLALWMTDKCVSSIQIVKAAALLAKSIADQASDLLDAIPIFGAIINNIIDFAADMATKGDYDDIMGFISDPDFRIQVACKLYCEWRDLPSKTITVQDVIDAASVVANWGATLPPGAPLITFYGQAFGLWVTSVSGTELHRHAAVHQDERSDDCLLLCAECAPEGDCLSLDNWFYGTVTSQVDNGDGTWTFHVASTAAPDATEAIRWQRETGSCEILSFDVTDPVGPPGWYQSFDTDPAGDCIPKSGFTSGCTRCVQYIQNNALTTPFHAIITIGAECP